MYKIEKKQVVEIMQLLQMGAYPNVTVGKINEVLNSLNNLEKYEDSKIPTDLRDETNPTDKGAKA